MGTSKKTRKGSAHGETSPNPRGRDKTSQQSTPLKSPAVRSSSRKGNNSLKEETVVSDDLKHEGAKTAHLTKNKADSTKKESKDGSSKAPETPPAVMMSPIRRSSRAPVPSSRFKDMEMSTGSGRKRPLAASQSEESDGDVEASSKKKRKSSDKVQKQTPKRENSSKSTVDESLGKQEPKLPPVTEAKLKEEPNDLKITQDTSEKTQAAEDKVDKPQITEAVLTEITARETREGTSVKDEAKEEKSINNELGEKGQTLVDTVEEEVKPSDLLEGSASIVTEEQSIIEESQTYESTSSIPSGMVVEETVETVHTLMDEKDVIVVKKPDVSLETATTASSLTVINEGAKKVSPEIVIKSQEVTLQEKDGQTVAIITVPSNFGASSSADASVVSGSSKDRNSLAGSKTGSSLKGRHSYGNKNRHGYVLNKASNEPPVVTLSGHDGGAVMNVTIEHNTVKSVLKPKSESLSPKAPVKTYGRVLKQESAVASTMAMPNDGSAQTYSLLPQTLKAMTEGKTYSLLAPPSELKNMLKGTPTKGNSSPDAQQFAEASPPPQKVIIIAHASTADGNADTSSAVSVPSETADSVTVVTSAGKESVNEEVAMVGDGGLAAVDGSGAKESLDKPLEEKGDMPSGEGKELGGVEEKEVEEVEDKVVGEIENEEVVDDSKQPILDENADAVPKTDVPMQDSSDETKDGVEMSLSLNGDKETEEMVPSEEVVESTEQSTDILPASQESKTELAVSSNQEKLPVEEIVVTSDLCSEVKIEDNLEEDVLRNPSVNVLSTALAQAEKSQSSGTLKPQKIKLIENGIVYELQIFPEGESKSEDGKEEEGSICIKEEVTDEVLTSSQDVAKFSSGTQTFYTQKRGRPKTSEEGEETDAPVHKLATIVQEGDQKKHYYYVSVVPGKTLVGKYRQSVDPTLPGCMVNKQGEYCCKECDYKTDKKPNFYKHRRLHTGAKPHLCPVCKYQARTSSNLKRHMGIHDDIREFKCNQCTMSFRQKIHLERHVRYRHEEKRVKCPMCDYVCANLQPDLKMHIKRKHTQESGKTFSCPECKITIGSRRDLKQHLKFHKDGPELKLFCKECSFVTDCKSRLQRHLVVHSNVKPFHCGVCDYKATQKEHVLRHLRSQHKIEVTKTKRPWKKQAKNDPSDNAQANTRGDFTCGDKIFACNHCVMRFAKLINLYKHLHTQHSDIMPVETDGNYYCVVCEFSTTSKKNLLVHMRRHNMTDQTPPTHVYSCVLCRYVNPRRRNLFQHMRKKHNIDISSQVDMAGMKEEEVNAVQETGVKVTQLIQTDEGVYTQPTANTTTATLDGGQVETGEVVGGDIATVANMIKIEDLTRTQVNDEAGDDQTLVIDNSVAGEATLPMIHASSLMHHKAADAIEGLQALAGQAGFIIEEEVQGTDKQQTIVIEQPGAEVLASNATTLSDGSIVISADQGMVEEQIAIDGSTAEQISQIVESEEGLEVGSGMTSLELTEEQLSSLQNGDMIQIEGQVYLVELTQDPDSPDKQLLSFLPVTQAEQP